MRTFRYIYITGIVAVLAIVGCGRGTGEKGLTHDEVRAINERVLEKAIGQPDSALMMIERLRAGDFSVIDTTGAPKALQDRVFDRLFEQAEIAKYSDAERRQYEESKKDYWDYFSTMKTAKRKAREEEKIETVFRLKSMGLSLGQIAQGAGLDIESVKKLL